MLLEDAAPTIRVVDQAGGRAGFRVSWSAATLGLLIISVASLTTAIVVAGSKRADTLATVALGLAVISFAAQLIIALTQIQLSYRQSADSTRINADTRSLTTEVRATVDALLTTLSTQFDRVLTAALREQSPGESGGESSTSASGTEISAEVPTPVALIEAYREQLGAHGPRRRRPTEEGEVAIAQLQEWPSEQEGIALMQVLRSLDPWQVNFFREKADWELSRYRMGLNPSNWSENPTPTRDHLIQLGLVELSPPAVDLPAAERDDVTWTRLTEKGRRTAALLLGRHGPDWFRRERGLPPR